MDVAATFIADRQPTVLVQPTEGAFHHPTEDTQPTAMFLVASRQLGYNASPPQRLPMSAGVVGLVALDPLRPAACCCACHAETAGGFGRQGDTSPIVT